MSAPTPITVALTPALLLTAAWTMGGATFFLLAPQTAPGLLVICVVAPLGWHWAAKGRFPWHRPSAVFLALYLATAYLALNATWSLSPASAIFAVAMLLAFVSAVDVTLSTLRKNELRVLEAMAFGFLAGVVLGGAFLCFETFSGQWVRRLIMPLQPWLRPEARHTALGPDGATLLLPHLLNKNVAALTLLIWPAVLLVITIGSTRRYRILLLLGLIPGLAAILRSAHATSKVALLAGAAIWCLYALRPALARRTTVIGWAAMTLLVVPIATVLFSQKLYTAPWLFPSAQHRIIIWGYTSEQLTKAPILGAGINTAHVLNEIDRDSAPRAPGSEFRLSTSLHSHNVYLQTWYEAGAIGAVFLLAIGVLIVKSFMCAPPAAQPILHATFVSCALIAASSFSLWAPWFMASFGLTAVFAGLGSELLAKKGRQSEDCIAGTDGRPSRPACF